MLFYVLSNPNVLVMCKLGLNLCNNFGWEVHAEHFALMGSRMTYLEASKRVGFDTNEGRVCIFS